MKQFPKSCQVHPVKESVVTTVSPGEVKPKEARKPTNDKNTNQIKVSTRCQDLIEEQVEPLQISQAENYILLMSINWASCILRPIKEGRTKSNLNIREVLLQEIYTIHELSDITFSPDMVRITEKQEQDEKPQDLAVQEKTNHFSDLHRSFIVLFFTWKKEHGGGFHK